MRKVLFGSPIVGAVSLNYTKFVLDVARSNFPGVEISFAFVGGAIVNLARNELADYARQLGMDELVSMDKDLVPTLAELGRLLSHDEPVVCGLYPRKHLLTEYHVQGIDGIGPREDLLQLVKQASIGFSKIKVSVFEELARKTPERRHRMQETGRDQVWKHEFYPMGVVGKNTPEGKLKRIDEAMNSAAHTDEVADRIGKILDDTDFSDNNILGEDFYFCRLLREAQIPMYVDTALRITHTADVDLPVSTEMLTKMVAEPWRKTHL